MHRMSILIAVFALILWTTAVQAATGEAVIAGTDAPSSITGRVSVMDTDEGLKISAHLENVAPAGKHGFHIHEFGSCADSGKAAGGHYNPAGTEHGFLPDNGSMAAHAGDMGNIDIAEDGSGTLELLLPGVSLSGENPVAGRAVILHEKTDDFGQPTGNAGGRIACGTIILTKE